MRTTLEFRRLPRPAVLSERLFLSLKILYPVANAKARRMTQLKISDGYPTGHECHLQLDQPYLAAKPWL
jgi:hypothetical protein